MRLFGLFALALAVLFLPVAGRAAEPRLNVLMIAVDDMNNDLGCYGDPRAKTPNIDRLAKRGTRFDRAYCQFPLCSPSRTSLMTGLRPDTTQVYDLKLHFREVLPGVVTLPQMFMRNGYHTARVGKIYHYGNPGDIGTNGLDDEPSWDERFNPSGRDKVEEGQVINHTPTRSIGSSLTILKAEGTDEEQTDGMVATETIRLLQENKDRPFFIAAGFYRPHCPYIAPKKYFDLYPVESMSVPQGPWDYIKQVPEAALSSTQPWPIFGVTDSQAREASQAYHATISFVDAQVGRLLDELDRLKLTDRTVVLFWSDHGYHVGDHGLWLKQSLFERASRVPFIIASPGQKGAGAASGRTVELVDIYPTLADLCGLTPPKNLAGESLKPLLDDPEAAWDHPAFSQVWRGSFPGQSVRTERYRYTEWDNGKQGTQLYDYKTDRGYTIDVDEQKNLIDDPAYAAVRKEMQSLLKQNWANEYRPNKPGKDGAKKAAKKQSAE